MRLFEIANLPLHEQIFEFMRLNRIVPNRADFSRDYLGKSRSYLNTLKYTKHHPSIEAWLRLSEGIGSLLEADLHRDTKIQLQEYRLEIADIMNNC